MAMASCNVSGFACAVATDAVTDNHKPETNSCFIISLLISETDNGVLLRRSLCRHDAEDETNRHRYAKGDGDGHRRYDRADVGGALDDVAQDAADDDCSDSAGEADHHRLAQELPHDVLLCRAHRAPHTDLLDALEDRRQHDVHDPDPADD